MIDDEIHNPAGDLPPRDGLWPVDQPGAPRLSDIDVYRLLGRLGHSMHHLSARCWSTAAATALGAAAKALRLLASALYRANIRDHMDPPDQP